MQTRVLIDAHVHVYNCFDVELFLDSARINFEQTNRKKGDGKPCKKILALTEGHREDWFRTQRKSLFSDSSNQRQSGAADGWLFRAGEEAALLVAEHTDGYQIHIMAGRQIVTAENLEVLALGTALVFEDGAPIADVVQEVNACQALAVLPWGAGKWIGQRGQIVAQTASSFDDSQLLLGDNGNRPWFWPLPSVFTESGLINLPGSDPLPFANEARRPGSYGAEIDLDWQETRPVASLVAALKKTSPKLMPYGRPEGFWRFWRHQVRMQLIKRLR